MCTPETDPGMFARLAKETKEIHEGIVQVTSAWSNIESAMAVLLGTVINDPPNALASAIYFSPGSSDVRFKIVDAVFCELCGQTKLMELEPLIAPWQTLMTKLNRQRGVRNKVAHGQVTTIFKNGKNHVRFTAPSFHFEKFTEALKAGQLPGMTGNDIQQSAEKMRELSNIIHLFLPIAKAVRASDAAALPQALAEVIASLKKADAPKDGPTLPKPQGSRE
jgi:hypothetical protein